MSDRTREAIEFASIFVVSVIAIWFGVSLTNTLFKIVVLSISSAIIQAIGFVIMAVIILSILALIVVVLLWVSVKIWEAIVERLDKIQETLLKFRDDWIAETQDSAIDVLFLAAIGLFAALVCFTSTKDFMEEFVANSETALIEHAAAPIRLLALAAVACSVCKVFLLVPVRSIKIIAMLATLIVLGGTFSVLADRYDINLFSISRIRTLASAVWRSPHLEIFVGGLSVVLLSISVGYPFSSRWKSIAWI